MSELRSLEYKELHYDIQIINKITELYDKYSEIEIIPREDFEKEKNKIINSIN